MHLVAVVDVELHTSKRPATACVPHDSYCVRPARPSATACVPHNGRLAGAGVN